MPAYYLQVFRGCVTLLAYWPIREPDAWRSRCLHLTAWFWGYYRFAFAKKIQSFQLFRFCDASEIGYAFAVYVRVELSGSLIKSSLLIAKSKVAPVKTITIPRLELLGATLLADLLDMVVNTYSLASFDKIYAFSDLQVVLAWLALSPHKWHIFVANRVSHIQEKIPNVSWYHVSSLDNPADCASRGVTQKNLKKYLFWFHGLLFLDPTGTFKPFQPVVIPFQK